MDFRAAASAGYANGLMVEASTQGNQLNRRWKLDQPIPSYLACFSAGPYVSWKRNIASIPVEIAAAAVDTNKVASTYQHLPQAIACFQHWFGPFMWPKIGYSLVPFNSGAMEHATNIAIGRSFIDGTLSYETLWAHELSHHWWGDLATCTTAEDMWLNEGMASYSENLFTENVYGSDQYTRDVKDNLTEILHFTHHKEGGYQPVSGVPHSLTYSDHVYLKGKAVAHCLRGYMGDSLFFAGLQYFLNNKKFSFVFLSKIENGSPNQRVRTVRPVDNRKNQLEQTTSIAKSSDPSRNPMAYKNVD